MKPPNSNLASLLDVFSRELETELARGHLDDVSISWNPAPDTERTAKPDAEASAELIWWFWSLSIEEDCRLLAGASPETWQELFGLSDTSEYEIRERCIERLSPAVLRTTQSRFGSEVESTEPERADSPAADWTSVVFSVKKGDAPEMPIRIAVSHALELALGIPEEEPELEPPAEPETADLNSAGILLHVEMPVSISLGRSKLRMKELLHLTHGSIVELNQELGDEVEIRVNNCVIGYGEVVSVDGNYAVRILRMAPARKVNELRGALPGRVA